MAMSSPPSPSPPCDLELSITSARDLKNVNWKHGDLCAYAVAWVDEESKVATRVDASGDTNPSWVNQNFIIPVRKPIWEARLSIEIYHYHDKDKDKVNDDNNNTILPTCLVDEKMSRTNIGLVRRRSKRIVRTPISRVIHAKHTLIDLCSTYKMSRNKAWFR